MKLDRKLIRITDHSITKFIQRAGMKIEKGVRKRAFDKIKYMLFVAKPVILKDQYIAINLLSHNFKSAIYLQHGQFIFVVEEYVLKTIHTGNAKRWGHIKEEEE